MPIACSERFLVPLSLGAGFALVYALVGPTEPFSSMYVKLAEAFVQGRLDVERWAGHEVVPYLGRWYVPLPPVPAVTLIPAAALHGMGLPRGEELSTSGPAAVLGGINVALVYVLVRRSGVGVTTAAVLAIGFGTATHFWAAGWGSSYLYAQLCGVFFLLSSLLVATRRSWPLAAGLLLGLGAGARLPVGLALPLILACYGTRPRRAHLAVIVGVAAIAAPIAIYNIARFGSPIDFGYTRIPSAYGLVTDEPWYSEGIVSLSYVPRSLGWALFGGLSLERPFVSITFSGTSLLITAPIVFLAVRAKGALVPAAWIAVGLVMLPNFAHGAWGFDQHGYRFALDAMPIVMLLLGSSYRERAPDLPLVAAIVVAAGVNSAAFAILAR